jgi:hypothetical protein
MLKNRWFLLPWWCVITTLFFGTIITSALIVSKRDDIMSEVVKKMECVVVGVDVVGVDADNRDIVLNVVCGDKEYKSKNRELKDQFLSQLGAQKTFPIKMEAMLLKNGEIVGVKPQSGPLCQPNPCD